MACAVRRKYFLPGRGRAHPTAVLRASAPARQTKNSRLPTVYYIKHLPSLFRQSLRSIRGLCRFLDKREPAGLPAGLYDYLRLGLCCVSETLNEYCQYVLVLHRLLHGYKAQDDYIKFQFLQRSVELQRFLYFLV